MTTLDLIDVDSYINAVKDMAPNCLVYVAMDQMRIDDAGHWRYQYVFTSRHSEGYIVRCVKIIKDIIPNEETVKEVEALAKEEKAKIEKQFTEAGIKLKMGVWAA